MNFQIGIQNRIGERCIATEIMVHISMAIPFYNGIENGFPIRRTMDITFPKQGSFHVSVLIETKERMITCTTEMAVVG